VGEASHDVRAAFGLVTMVGLLATYHLGFGARHQLDFGLRMIVNQGFQK